MWRADSLEKTLMLGGVGGRRRRRQRMRWLDGITDSVDIGLSKLRSCWWTGRPGVLWFMGSQRVGHDSNWAELNWMWWDNKIMPNYILDTEKQVMEHKNATQYKHCAITNTHSHTHTHGKLMLTMNCPLEYVKLFFLFIFISWRLITLQYCSGFCHTLTWISHGFTC